jgi:hypothetical protein
MPLSQLVAIALPMIVGRNDQYLVVSTHDHEADPVGLRASAPDTPGW